MRATNLNGKMFGRLFVIKRAPIDFNRKNRAAQWVCRCECGAETIARSDQLKSGHTKSCGCLTVETALTTHKTHGHTCGGRFSREYTAWVNMKKRCTDQNSRHWKNYSGRGIKVCRRWSDSFDAFYADMGNSPGKGYELDRTDNDGNYKPGNCRWVTKAENNANRRNTRRKVA